ncbi:hypothetical protein [Maribacter sp. 1_2014MBL_MicDiv]|uniref:hypothetical protein n=1 Tax=Maribacter sp. 1_2014MBL_MicDiv TaxID=1644130 RepID=UPI0008F50618|nr:hypothetical protein [Maribacter sp. 1_2014MBL_MicDiv]APA64214.1 hypothetical protein YQ22_07700 [Maribacter sp. 1_2014MBL_MicDiv]
MIDFVIGTSIIIGLGYLGFLVNEYLIDNTVEDLGKTQRDEFCEIDLDHMLMYSDQSKAKDLNELKRKLQDFKNRNKFYKM